MFKYFLKKFLVFVSSIYIVITVTFGLMHAVPGNPFSEEEVLSGEIIETFRSHYGLDLPLFDQYLKYLSNLARGDLGPSLKYHEKRSNDFIIEGFPVSCVLGLQALCLSLFAGIPLGALAAFSKGKWQDHLVSMLGVISFAVPSFILGSLLQYWFAVRLDWLPIGQWGSFQQTILPALSLASLPLAVIARLSRNSILEVLQQDYIVTARAKGLSTFQIFKGHVLKNSLLPVVTYLGPVFANILTGSFVIEHIFNLPGLGKWFVISILNRDYPVILSLTIFYSTLLMGSIFIVDLIYGWLDPRVKRI